MNSNVKNWSHLPEKKSKRWEELFCEFKDKVYVLEFQIVDHDVIPVLGLQTCQELDVIQKVESVKSVSSEGPEPSVSQKSNILDEFSDKFHGLGKLKNYEHHIEIDKSVPSVVHPPRRVPFALHDKVKKVLQRMESMGVIEKVFGPTE